MKTYDLEENDLPGGWSSRTEMSDAGSGPYDLGEWVRLEDIMPLLNALSDAKSMAALPSPVLEAYDKASIDDLVEKVSRT